MEALYKTVVVSCLIYVLYGLMSFLELGHFIPPLPLKPFLFLIILVVFLVESFRTTFSTFNLLLILWLGTLILKGQFLIETFFNYDSILWYLEHLEPLVFYASIILFSLLILFFLKEIKASIILTYGFTLAVLSLMILSFYTENYFLYDWGIVFTSLFIFVLSRFKANVIGLVSEKPLIILYGVGVINVIEQVTYALS